MKRLWVQVVLVVSMLLLVAGSALAQGQTPAVEVSDQETDGKSVVVDKVVYDQAGWIVIHMDADGKPGPVIGWAAIEAGENMNVEVMLKEPLTDSAKLWAMLHTDAGTMGQYEFPGDDVPVKVDDKVVVKPFTASLAPATLPVTGSAGSSNVPLALMGTGLLLVLAALAFRFKYAR